MTRPTFEWVTTPEGLEALRSDWQALDDGGAPGAVFRSWEWQATWWRRLGARGRRELRVLVVRQDGRTRALLPLYVEDAPVLGLVPRRRVGLLADGVVGSDYLGLVAAADDAIELAPAIARRLATDPALDDAHVLELADLLDGDPLGVALADALASAGWEVVSGPRYLCPYAPIGRATYDGYLAARPQGFGRQLAQRRRTLERLPGFRLEIAASPEEVVGGLEHLFALHRRRWREEGGSEAFTNPAVEAFHRDAARRLAERGWARVAVLHAEGQPVAAGYGFARAGRFAYYQAGMDPGWRRRSAGLVVLGALLERAFDEALHEFDFLRGAESYKAIWADCVRRTTVVRARPATPTARRVARAERAAAALRRAARRALPDVAARALRGWVRRSA